MKKSIAAVIKNEYGEVLLQNHIKVDAYTLPGGKVDENELEKVALIREIFEELGILVYRYNEILTHDFKNIEYPAHSKNYKDFHQVYYEIDKYEGDIFNKEPEKHSSLLWIRPDRIRGLGKISKVLDIYLKSLNL